MPSCKKRSALGITLGFLFVCLVESRLAATETVARPPNFIVIFCDNLGYGDIEPFGSDLHRTPHLTRMANEGRKFTQFYVSAGVCTPSRASLMTGCYSQRVGMHVNERDGHVLRPVSPYGLSAEEETIAEVLERANYATGIFGKWHLGDQPPFLPTEHGFQTFFGIPYSDDMTQAVGMRIGSRLDGSQWPPLPLMRDQAVVEAPVDRNQLTQRLTEAALEFIDQHQDQPFFLYFPQAMPGSTSAPFASEAFRGKSRNGPWGDSIEELDWSTGEILGKLKELNLETQTLVIWTSDNGAPLARPSGDLSRGSNLPLHGRGYTTSEGAFRVPTIFWWPTKIQAHTICDQLASTMDLLPTFAELASVEPPSNKIDGLSITQLLFDQKAVTPHDAYYYYDRDQLQAVRSGPWKLFLPLSDFNRHPHFEKGGSAQALLFNLDEDIDCSSNLASSYPKVVGRLMKMAEEAKWELGDRGVEGHEARQRGQIANPKPLRLKAR